MREVSTLIKATGGSHKQSSERDGQLNGVELDSWDVNISFYLKLRSYIAINWLASSEKQISGLEVIQMIKGDEM